jgi:hypothetical protein
LEWQHSGRHRVLCLHDPPLLLAGRRVRPPRKWRTLTVREKTEVKAPQRVAFTANLTILSSI